MKLKKQWREQGFIDEAANEGIDLKAEIRRMCKEKDAIILAHYYTVGDIQDIADFVGDSLALARKAAETDARMMVMCGVHFMAETCKLLSPEKTVLCPDLNAGCSLADSCKAEDLKKFKDEHPGYQVVSYVNTTAAVKALTDVVVTSGNAKELKQQYPEAVVMAHLECKGPVLALADVKGSTATMLQYSQQSDKQQFIVATEAGILHEMQRSCPGKEFIPVPPEISESGLECSCNECQYMKMNTLLKVYNTLKYEWPVVEVDAEIAQEAVKPIERMLELS